ncbi:MAG: endo-alpha-mannosidase, partial [Bacteroidia bacterium]|nr:endo-alpha-mannosidase [Bacteroidia bacterium]
MKNVLALVLVSIFLAACSKDDKGNLSNPNEFTVTPYAAVDVSKSFTTPVLAHYMPWFESPQFAEYGQSQFGNWGLHWTMSNKNPDMIDGNGKREIASHYYPLIEPYDNGEPHYLEYAVVCMKLAGLDGIIIDYAGTTEVYDWKLLHDHTEAIIPWLNRAGLQFSIMYEDKSLLNAYNLNIITDTIAEVKNVMQYMDDNFFNKDHYLHLNQKPVLFNFGPQALFTDSSWIEAFADIQDLNF